MPEYERDGVWVSAPDMAAANEAFGEHFAKPLWMQKNFIGIGAPFRSGHVTKIDRDAMTARISSGLGTIEYQFKKDGSWHRLSQGRTPLPAARVVKE